MPQRCVYGTAREHHVAVEGASPRNALLSPGGCRWSVVEAEAVDEVRDGFTVGEWMFDRALREPSFVAGIQLVVVEHHALFTLHHAAQPSG